jgi:hypothetical protein
MLDATVGHISRKTDGTKGITPTTGFWFLAFSG